MKTLIVTAVLGVCAILLSGAFRPPAAVDSGAENPAAGSFDPPGLIDPFPIMRLITDGRADSVLTLLGSDQYIHTTDPYVLLLRARAMRDQLPDEDANKDLIRAGTGPIHDLLDQTISLCNEALSKPAASPKYRYFRGRAWLGKAQLHTLTRDFWSAGRNAGHAKGDLEKYVALVPTDPDAQGELGGFLYFADTLPGAIKFLSRLLFFPTGDRERGMRMMQYGADHKCVFQVDFQITLAAVYLLFEGRFEEGISTMKRLIREHPAYTRLVEPFGLIAPLDPLRMREYQQIEDEVIATHMRRRVANLDRSLIKRIELHRAFNDQFFASPARALVEFNDWMDNPEERPDWATPLAIANRAILYAKMGEIEMARGGYHRIKASQRMKHFHKLSSGMLEALERPVEPLRLEDLDFIQFIYDNRLSEAKPGLDRYRNKYGEDVIYHFYLGEYSVFEQNFTQAAQAYQAALEPDAHNVEETYQMFAACRLAEIRGSEGRAHEARELFEQAMKLTHAGFLLDFLMHSRLHFYELLDDGEVNIRPTMLIRKTERADTSTAADH